MIACLQGFFVGDTVGNPLEYMLITDITEDAINNAFNMQGGGIHKMKPAQKSGESEICLCMINYLSQNDCNLDINQIMSKIAEWLKTKPKNVNINYDKIFGHDTSQYEGNIEPFFRLISGLK